MRNVCIVILASLFWDDDGGCYHTGNAKPAVGEEWLGKRCIYIQELDLEEGKLIGERKEVTLGHGEHTAAG